MTAAERAVLYAEFPYVFATERLGLEPDPGLELVMTSDAAELLLLWSRQCGKTTALAARVVHFALFNPGALVLITSATLRQAQILQGRVTGFLRQLRRTERWQRVRNLDVPLLPDDPLDDAARLERCSVMQLEMAHGSAVISTPADQNTVRGYAPDLIVVDEAARCRDALYSALRPMRAVTSAPLLVGSTAGARLGWFYEEWSGGDPGWTRSECAARDCSRISEAFLAREREKLVEPFFRAEYENQFMARAGALLDHETRRAMFDTDVEPLEILRHIRPGSQIRGLLDAEVEVLR